MHLGTLPCQDAPLLLLSELTCFLLPGEEEGGLAQASPSPCTPFGTKPGHRPVRDPFPGPRCCHEQRWGEGTDGSRSGSRMKTLEVLWGKRKEGQREAEKRPSPDAFQ